MAVQILILGLYAALLTINGVFAVWEHRRVTGPRPRPPATGPPLEDEPWIASHPFKERP